MWKTGALVGFGKVLAEMNVLGGLLSLTIRLQDAQLWLYLSIVQKRREGGAIILSERMWLDWLQLFLGWFDKIGFSVGFWLAHSNRVINIFSVECSFYLIFIDQNKNWFLWIKTKFEKGIIPAFELFIYWIFQSVKSYGHIQSALSCRSYCGSAEVPHNQSIWPPNLMEFNAFCY